MKISAVSGFIITKPTLMLSENDVLASINSKACTLPSQVFRTVVPTIKHMEKDACRVISQHLGGEKSISCTQDVNCDLRNATHYDVSDGSIGCSVWIELDPVLATNWYFILPNVLLRNKEFFYNEVAIRLYHGVGVAWDGRVVRHGTTLTSLNCKSNHCFGWFWAADMKGAKLSLMTELICG